MGSLEGDEIVAAARIKIAKDGWTEAMEAAIFGASDGFSEVAAIIRPIMDGEPVRPSEALADAMLKAGTMIALAIAVLAEKRGVDLSEKAATVN